MTIYRKSQKNSGIFECPVHRVTLSIYNGFLPYIHYLPATKSPDLTSFQIPGDCLYQIPLLMYYNNLLTVADFHH